MSFGDLVLGPNYTIFGTDATLTIAAANYAIRAIDRTSGTALVDGIMQTVEPSAAIRVADLTVLALAKAQLDSATLSLNGALWRVVSVRPIPSPAGVADGEYLLLLEGT